MSAAAAAAAKVRHKNHKFMGIILFSRKSLPYKIWNGKIASIETHSSAQAKWMKNFRLKIYWPLQ